MTDTAIEQWEPDSRDEALAVVDRGIAMLDAATTVEEVTALRDQAEMVAVWVRRRNENQEIELRTQTLIRNAERKLAELMEELKAAGKVRGAGRPRKPVAEQQDSEEIPVVEQQVSARDVFGDSTTQRDALLFASVNDDEWEEALADARKNGDMSRRALARALRPGGSGIRARSTERSDIPTVSRVVPQAIRALSGVLDALHGFDPAQVDVPERGEWAKTILTHTKALDEWRKALPK